MLYAIIILFSMAVIAAVDIIFFARMVGFLPYQAILGVIIMTVLEIAFNGLVALIIRRALPSKWFGVDKNFSASKKERVFYEKIGIKKWKDKVLELGCFTNFHKDKIEDPKSPEYVKRYIVEANYGVVIHFALLFLSFAVIFFFPLEVWYCFAFPVAIVSVFLNALPLFILRYNLAKLNTLYSVLIKRKIKSAA